MYVCVCVCVCVCTLPPSTCLVNMTIVVGLCSQIILQKSRMVPPIGPWAAMYVLLRLYPCGVERGRGGEEGREGRREGSGGEEGRERGEGKVHATPCHSLSSHINEGGIDIVRALHPIHLQETNTIVVICEVYNTVWGTCIPGASL